MDTRPRWVILTGDGKNTEIIGTVISDCNQNLSHNNLLEIEVKSSTSRMWNVVGAERTRTTPNRI
jgi:hypothetical protein